MVGTGVTGEYTCSERKRDAVSGSSLPSSAKELLNTGPFMSFQERLTQHSPNQPQTRWMTWNSPSSCLYLPVAGNTGVGRHTPLICPSCLFHHLALPPFPLSGVAACPFALRVLSPSTSSKSRLNTGLGRKRRWSQTPEGVSETGFRYRPGQGHFHFLILVV